jgi:hypothetical protein
MVHILLGRARGRRRDGGGEKFEQFEDDEGRESGLGLGPPSSQQANRTDVSSE